MLQQILRLMAHDGVARQDELATRLGVSGVLLSEMLAQLARQGYLTEAELCEAGAGCDGCALSRACGAPRVLRLWTLTEKGLRAAGPEA
jgi:Mn-dependent DtxR family transcriptional regulator